MYQSEIKSFKLFFYSLLVGLPGMFVGYLKDKVSLLKTPSNLVADDVRSQGIHIFRDLLSEQEIKALLNDFENLKEKFAIDDQGQLSGRIYKQGVLSPLLGEYAEKIRPYVVDILNTDRIKVEISYFQESFPSVDVNDIPGGELHVDDNKANLKYFIYLSDVNEKNGPFSCVPGSGNWRMKGSLIRGFFWELTKKRKYLYGYLINIQAYEKQEKMIVGPKGTQFLVDTTTLHRAKPVIHGERKVAVISFNRIGVI